MSEKIKKLQSKLDETKEKRAKLNEAISKLQKQIKEEEEKEFRSVLEEMSLTFEEAVTLLKNKGKHSKFSSVSNDTLERQDSKQKEGNHYEHT